MVCAPVASFHSRSSPGTAAATGFGFAKLLPRSVEWVAVTPAASVRLVTARLGTPEAGKLTAMSASPPPSAMPDGVAARGQDPASVRPALVPEGIGAVGRRRAVEGREVA